VSDSDDLVAALSLVSAALTKLGIRHYVGGNVASSFHGASRSTMDVDLVADMSAAHVSAFLQCFNEEFYPQRSRGPGRNSEEVLLQPHSSSHVLQGRCVYQSPAAV
jgi:hypothetical protein